MLGGLRKPLRAFLLTLAYNILMLQLRCGLMCEYQAEHFYSFASHVPDNATQAVPALASCLRETMPLVPRYPINRTYEQRSDSIGTNCMIPYMYVP